MPPKREGTFSKKAVIMSYVNAYLHKLEWSSIFTDPSCNFLQHRVKELNSRMEIIFPLLLGSTSALMGPGTTVRLTEGHCLPTNLYLLAIGKCGIGKTPAFAQMVEKPIREIEAEFQLNLDVQEFTRPALLSFMSESNGWAFLRADEICHNFDAFLTSRGGGADCSASFRSNLNNFFCGSGYSKRFATKDTVNFAKSYVTVLGTSQPHPYCNFLQKLRNMDDGLRDRFLALSAPVPTEPLTQPPIAVHFDQNWVKDILRDIYVRHHEVGAGSNKTYRFSPDALEHYKSVKEASEEHMSDQYQALAEALQSDSEYAAFGKVPDDEGESKETDIAIKLAAVLHVLRHELHAYLTGALRLIPIPLEISLETLQLSLSIVSVARAQEADYIECIDAHRGPEPEATFRISSGSKTANDPLYMATQLLKYPGRVVSSRMYLRKYPRSHAASVIQAMVDLSKDPGAPHYTGIYGKFRSTNAFYKAAWENVDSDWLTSIGVREEENVAAYEADMSSTPANGITKEPGDWPAYYANLMDHMPDMEAPQ